MCVVRIEKQYLVLNYKTDKLALMDPSSGHGATVLRKPCNQVTVSGSRQGHQLRYFVHQLLCVDSIEIGHKGRIFAMNISIPGIPSEDRTGDQGIPNTSSDQS